MQHRNKKYQKVLRRSSGSNRRVTPLEIIIGTVLIVVLVGAGWVMYTPIYNAIMGIDVEKPPKEIPQSSEPQVISSSSEISSEPEVNEPVSKEEALKAVYIPMNIANDSDKLKAFLDTLKDTGVNAVMLDLKNQVGNVLYDSKLELTQRAASVIPEPIELEKTINLIEAEGFITVGRVNAFMDSIAPALLNQASVKYQGTDINWIDNYANQGGKLWLNPYSDLAQQYIAEICVEAVKGGVKYIVLDSVQFPTGVGLEKAYYGESANNVTKSEQLSKLTKNITTAVEAENGKLFVYLSVNSMLGINSAIYGDTPQNMIDNGLVLGTMPISMGSRLESTKLILDNPSATPYESVLKTVSAVKADIPSNAGVVGMVQAFDNTQADIDAQIKALEESGITSYIYYSTNGNYSFK